MLLLHLQLHQLIYASGVIKGNVKATDGKPITNARISITNTVTGAVTITATNKDGVYTSKSLADGTYAIKINAMGYRLSDVTTVTDFRIRFEF